VLRIGDLELNVAVLEDKTRIVTHSDVFKSLGRTPRGNARLIGIPAFMDAKNLQPLTTLLTRLLLYRLYLVVALRI
jgi:hypothetical protein